MPKFEVDIIETLQKRVEVEADSMDDAVELVRDNYYDANDSEYILTADNSNVSVEFEEVNDGLQTTLC